MADALNDSSQEKKEETNKKSNILEEKSKEELIKLVKKYLNLLQKSKNKTDELNKKYIALEQEKDSAIQAYKSSQQELLNKIETLQHSISNEVEEGLSSPEKDQVIDDLRCRLKEAIEEKNRCTSSLRENEEQVQCLNLQLQSLKASCQYIQEDYRKLQESHKEKVEESNVLHSKIEELQSENKQLKDQRQDNDLTALFNENQKLQNRIKELQIENERLRDQVQDEDITMLFKKNQELENKIKDYNSKAGSLNLNKKIDCADLVTNQTDDVKKPKYSLDELKKENMVLIEQSENMKSELDMSYKRIHRLEEEVKKLASVSDLDDYKMGIELALLQGATTESLLHPSEQLSASLKKSQSETELLVENIETVETGAMYTIHDTSGFEYALLQGADTSKLIVETNDSSNNSSAPQTSEYKAVNTEPLIEIEKMSSYMSLLEEKEVEIEKLKYNLSEYSSLLKETADEKDDLQIQIVKLKEQVDEFKRKGLVLEKATNESEIPKDTKNVENTEKAVEEHESPRSESLPEKEYIELYENLCNKIRSLYDTFQSEKEYISKLETSVDPLAVLQNIHNMHIEVIIELKKKSSQLNDYNLQLELLVIGIKQGVRQKTSFTTYQTENNLEENMTTLKTLLDELIMRSNTYASKLKNLESSSVADKKKMEKELVQLKELNQFLEDENRELNNELKKFKDNIPDEENCNNAYIQSPELYSIEESNESEDKTDTNVDLISNVEGYPCTSNISVSTFISVKESAVQVESDLFIQHIDEKDAKISEIISTLVQTEQTDENRIIDELKCENESLKIHVHEKCSLVESIHCEMDSLLTKVEELSEELKIKEDDLNQAQSVNTQLKKTLSEMHSMKQQKNDALILTQESIQALKEKNANLNEDVKSFKLNFQDIMCNVNENFINAITENFKSLNYYVDMCVHKERHFNIIKEWIEELTKEFECWQNFIDQFMQISDPTSELNLSELEKFKQSSLGTILNEKTICDQDICCLIFENVTHLDSCKSKVFSSFYNHLNSNYNSLINMIQDYKINIVPNIEKNLIELEKKIANCTCQGKQSKIAVENVQEKNSEEQLKTTLAETESKMNKLKQIALKLKKELGQMKDQYNDVSCEKEKLQKQYSELLEEFNKISDDQCKSVQNYQSLQNEFDKLQDDCEMYKGNVKKLEEGLAAKLIEHTSLKEQNMEIENQLKSSKNSLECSLHVKKELEIKIADLESKVIVLESKISEKEQKVSSMATDIAKHLKDLNAAWEDNKSLKDQLELAQKEGNKKSLLDLEMADYERSITELNNKIQRKDDEMEELQKELDSLKERYDCLLEEIQSTEKLKETEAKRAESLKEILEKTKSELNKVKEHEAELLTKTASLEVQIETMAQQEETFKLRYSDNLSQIQHLQDVIKASSENHQRIVRSFEQKISNQKEEILLAHKEVESVKQEFENYKIRVHSVLKQQKNVTPPITAIDIDLKEKLETMNEKLKLQVKDLSEKQTALSLEYKTLQEEHDNLLLRYNKLIDDREQKDKEWHQRLELVNAEKNRLRATQEELSSQHLLQNEMLVATYKKQIKIMSEEHKRIVNDLQTQLDAADVEIARLQRDQQKLQGLPLTPLPQDTSTSFDILSQERQEGEGSESTDETTTPIRHLSLATIPTSGFLPFEKLIQAPLEPGTPSSYISNADSDKLIADLSTANKKIDHLSEILNDSESTNLRLSEQVRVLKDEVRRLENNKEREQHAENLEYLKNVFIKFSSLEPGSEKAMLIPVLTTMLKLDHNEQQQLKSVAGDIDSGDNANSGWGSYLHRWSGLS